MDRIMTESLIEKMNFYTFSYPESFQDLWLTYAIIQNAGLH